MNSTIKLFHELPDEAVVPISTGMVILGSSRSTIFRLLDAGTLTRVKVLSATKLKVGELRRLTRGEAAPC